MFRCCNEDCRQQSSGFKLTGQRINIKFIDKDNFEIISHKQPMDKELFVSEHYNHKMQCNLCGHKDKVKYFMKAYESPMLLFDTDNLCVCGGEIWKDIESVKTDELPNNAEWEGSQRRVSVKIRSINRCERCNKEFD